MHTYFTSKIIQYHYIYLKHNTIACVKMYMLTFMLLLLTLHWFLCIDFKIFVATYQKSAYLHYGLCPWTLPGLSPQTPYISSCSCARHSKVIVAPNCTSNFICHLSPMHIYMCVYMYICIYVYMYICINVYKYICIHECVYVCVCV